jgi:glycosyltransferase involved in cell wall biosynthesis
VDDFDRRIAHAEALFADGLALEARDALQALAGEAAGDPVLLSRVLSDLGVITSSLGLGGAHALLARAVHADPANADALENLAAVCAAEGDAGQAAHWLRRTLAVDPGRASAREALVAALEATHDWALADAARHAAAGDGRRPRLLVLAHVFHPSVGGTELLAEQAALALRERGWDVEVGTEPHPRRTAAEHRGIPVHELPDDGGASLTALLGGRPFDAILAYAGPLGWPIVIPPTLPHPRPRLVLVPCVNPDGYAQIDASPQIRGQYAGLLRQADVVVHSSEHGWDARLMRELGVRSTCVPNAAARTAPGREPQPRTGTRLLCVGNLWEEKDHVGLLRTLRGVPGDWTLRIIGGEPPAHVPNPAPTLRALAGEDDRIQLTGPAPAAEVAAAMAEADVLLLPSRVEATPLVLVEAMSQGLPWIATPTCGSAGDHAGGLIAPLGRFPGAVAWILGDDDARRALGAAGREHYDAAYAWDVVADRFDALLAGADALPATPMPPEAAQATTRARERWYDALLAGAAGAAGAAAVA